LVALSPPARCPPFSSPVPILPVFSFTHPPPPEIYTLSLHDALPICSGRERGWRRSPPSSKRRRHRSGHRVATAVATQPPLRPQSDRKSTRLNSSHVKISYAVFCLKKKKNIEHSETISSGTWT